MKINKYIAVKLIATGMFLAGTSSNCGKRQEGEHEAIALLTPEEILPPSEIEKTKKAEKEAIKYLEIEEVNNRIMLLNKQKNAAKMAQDTIAQEAAMKDLNEIYQDPRFASFEDALDGLYKRSKERLLEEIDAAENKFSILSDSQKPEIYKNRIKPCFDMLQYIPTSIANKLPIGTPARNELVQAYSNSSSFFKGRYNYTEEFSK